MFPTQSQTLVCKAWKTLMFPLHDKKEHINACAAQIISKRNRRRLSSADSCFVNCHVVRNFKGFNEFNVIHYSASTRALSVTTIACVSCGNPDPVDPATILALKDLKGTKKESWHFVTFRDSWMSRSMLCKVCCDVFGCFQHSSKHPGKSTRSKWKERNVKSCHLTVAYHSFKPKSGALVTSSNGCNLVE